MPNEFKDPEPSLQGRVDEHNRNNGKQQRLGNVDEVIGRHFESLGNGMGPVDELFKSGDDIVSLLIRGRIPEDRIPDLLELIVDAEMHKRGNVQEQEFYMLVAGYYTAMTIGKNGQARGEFLRGLAGHKDEPKDNDQQSIRFRGRRRR